MLELNKLPEELRKKLSECKTKEDAIALLTANGINVTGELSDKDLEKVAGGFIAKALSTEEVDLSTFI